MIYLASPYSFNQGTPEKNRWVEQVRYQDTLEYCGELFESGHHVISPVVHLHRIARMFSLDKDFDSWSGYNKDLLQRCDQLFIYKLPGWKESKGVSKELEIAREEGLPVKKQRPETDIINHHKQIIYEATNHA